MQCGSCGITVSRIAFFLAGHTCKQMPKLGPAFTDSRTEIFGRGRAWMPQKYAEYYATYPAVYAAVKLRADAVLNAPLVASRRIADGNLEDLTPDHPLRLLLNHVNPWWTLGDLLRATSIYLDLWGSCFWILKKSGAGVPPTEIWCPRPDKMSVVPSQDRYLDGFWYQAGVGTRIPFRPDEVVWFRQINPLDEYAGLSPIAPARLSIEMGHEGIQHNRNIFRNGILAGNLAFTAKDGTMTVQQAAEFRDALKERYSKPENSHIPIIMGNFDVKNLGLTNRDLEFMASLRWSLEDVARVYAIPKPMLGDLERATYENIDAAERIFWRSSMVPHLRFIQDELNEMLLPMFGNDIEVAFDLSKVEALQEDANAVAERNIAEVAAGIKTINEVREQQGLEPVAWGDVWFAPFGVQPISSPEDAQPPMLPGEVPGDDDGAESVESGSRSAYSARRSLRLPITTLSALSDSYVGRILEFHDRILTKVEAEFRAMQTGLFVEQKRDIMKRLAAQGRGADWTAKRLPSLDLFNLGDWIRRFLTVGLPTYKAIANLNGTQQANAFSLGISFDVEKMADWLQQRSGFWATMVNEETGRLLMNELGDGIGKGESVRKLQDRVERVFEFTDAVRSERIARTETQAATNAAAVEAYRQSGIVPRKMWLATLDSRVRDAHLAAHRQVVELEAKFLVGGEALDAPGDGSPENAINCRCVVVPLVSRQAWRPMAPVLVNGTKPIGG